MGKAGPHKLKDIRCKILTTNPCRFSPSGIFAGGLPSYKLGPPKPPMSLRIGLPSGYLYKSEKTGFAHCMMQTEISCLSKTPSSKLRTEKHHIPTLSRLYIIHPNSVFVFVWPNIWWVETNTIPKAFIIYNWAKHGISWTFEKYFYFRRSLFPWIKNNVF